MLFAQNLRHRVEVFEHVLSHQNVKQYEKVYQSLMTIYLFSVVAYFIITIWLLFLFIGRSSTCDQEYYFQSYTLGHLIMFSWENFVFDFLLGIFSVNLLEKNCISKAFRFYVVLFEISKLAWIVFGLFLKQEDICTLEKALNANEFYTIFFLQIYFTLFNFIMLTILSLLTAYFSNLQSDDDDDINERELELQDQNQIDREDAYKNIDTLAYCSLVDPLQGKFNLENNCSVCLEKLNTKDVIMTPCMHLFHHQCLIDWTVKNHICCMCRKSLLV